MKKINIILFLLLFMAIPMFANDARLSVENGFAKGDASVVASAMDERVFMVAYPLRRPLDKSEAEKELAKFFEHNKPTSFTVLHDNGQGGVIYMISKLKTQKGEYRVHILIDEEGETQRITQIRIETL